MVLFPSNSVIQWWFESFSFRTSCKQRHWTANHLACHFENSHGFCGHLFGADHKWHLVGRCRHYLPRTICDCGMSKELNKSSQLLPAGNQLEWNQFGQPTSLSTHKVAGLVQQQFLVFCYHLLVAKEHNALLSWSAPLRIWWTGGSPWHGR